MNNEQLNKAIRNTEDREEFIVKELEGTGKCIPYLGWFWRDVDFNCEYGIEFGILPKITSSMERTDGWVGFMENNKWGYDGFRVKGKQQKELRKMVEQAVTDPSNQKLQALFDYMQTLRPKETK